jgi:hypothetical protein
MSNSVVACRPRRVTAYHRHGYLGVAVGEHVYFRVFLGIMVAIGGSLFCK